jgi:hypothetical protein
MTRTDVVATSRPHGALSAGGGRRRPRAGRALVALPIVLILGAVLVAPGSALAASEGLSGYSQTPTTPKSGTSPSKETSAPSSPSSSGVAAKSESPAKAKSSTLPFTGFDLRWSLAIGFTLIAAGASLLVVQRRGGGSVRR